MDDFRLFMRKMLEMRSQRQAYDTHFGTATERFVEACRKIVNAPEPNRLGSLLKHLFDNAGLAAELDVPEAIAEAQARIEG